MDNTNKMDIIDKFDNKDHIDDIDNKTKTNKALNKIVLNTPKKFTFKNLPITIEHEIVTSTTSHPELLHWHENVELIRIKKGNIHCHVNDSDFILNPGELCFINYDQLHRIYNTEKNVCSVDVLTINSKMLDNNDYLYKTFIKPIIDNKNFGHIKMNGRNSYALVISKTFDSIYDLIINKPLGYELEVVGLIYMIFRRLYLVYMSEKNSIKVFYDRDIDLQRRMTSFIYENYNKKISLSDISNSSGVSRSKCAKLFQKYTQSTPIAFLNSYRLEMAATLLSSTEDPISEIALSCGFYDQSYFNRMFLREFNMTPLEWRKKYVNIEQKV